MKNYLAIVAGLGASLSAIAGYAQDTSQSSDANGGLAEIVVTAQRRSQNLQDVPIAVTAISGERLSSAVIQSTQDLAAVTPGLTFPSDFLVALPHIRGVGSTAVAPGAENSVATYIDGVYYAASSGANLTLNNVSQVEVLKGPQGTLFGRNATGGLIQIITKDPSDDPHGEVNLSYGNYQTSSLDAYATGGLLNNLAGDVALQVTRQGEGYGRNEYNGTEIFQLQHEVSLRSKLLWTPVDGTKLLLIGDYEDSKNSISLAEVQGTAAANPFYPPVAIVVPPYNANSNIQPLDTLKGGGVSLKLEQDVGFADLVNIAGWRRSVTYYTVDFDLGPNQLISDLSSQFDEQVTEELQLRSHGEGPLTWTAGAFYFHAKDGFDPLNIGLGEYLSPIIGPGSALTNTLATATQKTDSIAGYAQATYAVTSADNVTVGVRLTHEKRELDASENGIINDAVQVPLIPALTRSFSVNKPTWRVAFDHKFTDSIMSYVSYNRGFKSGGYNPGDPTGPSYQPEQLDAYEAGMKTQMLDHRLRVNGAVFYYKYNDIQVSRFVDGNPDVYNGAKAKLYGVDLDMDAALSDHFQVSAGIEAIHDEFTDFPCADFFAGGPNVSSPACSASAAPELPYLRSAAGNKLPVTPDFTSSVTLEYHAPLLNGIGSLSITDAYNSGYFYEPNNGEPVKQSTFNLINASATWTTADKRFHVRLWGKNLTDKLYTFEQASSPEGFAESFAPPRTYGVTVGTKF